MSELSAQLREIKKGEYSQFYRLNSFVDARDSYHIWRVGKISEINNNNCLITFDGWLPKWNEVIIFFGSFFNLKLN